MTGSPSSKKVSKTLGMLVLPLYITGLNKVLKESCFCPSRWSSTAPSHPTWHLPRRPRSLASGLTAGPTLSLDWALPLSNSWPRWDDTFLQNLRVTEALDRKQSETDRREYSVPKLSLSLDNWLLFLSNSPLFLKDEPHCVWQFCFRCH